MRIRNLVVHACHDCVLNCFGCNHFSAFHKQDKYRLDPTIFKKDLDRIRKIATIRELHLCGGEPLLHRGIIDCILAMSGFPAENWLKTNGLLLHTQGEDFWRALADAKCAVQITDYGVLRRDLLEKSQALAKKHKVLFRINQPDRWHLRFQVKDFSERHAKQAFKDCDYGGYKYLENGKLYACSIAAYGKPYFEKRDMTWVDTGVSIYEPSFFDECKRKWVCTSNCQICCVKEERQIGVPWRRITREEIDAGVNS